MLSLYPRGETETPAPDTSNLVQLALIHPRTNSLCMFLLDEAQIKYAFSSLFHIGRRLFEIQTVTRGSRSNGSFLVEPDKLVHRTDLTIHSEIDPFFILLPYMITVSSNPEGLFIDFIDFLNAMIASCESERGKEGLTKLIQALNSSSNFKEVICGNFFETRNVMDRLLVKPRKEGMLTWLSSKIKLIEEYIRSSDVFLVEVAANPEEFPKIFALELVRCYITEELFAQLVSHVGYNTELIFADKTPTDFENTNTANSSSVNSVAKRASAAPSQQSTAKKQKDAAIAKTCMKMTAFFKPKS